MNPDTYVNLKTRQVAVVLTEGEVVALFDMLHPAREYNKAIQGDDLHAAFAKIADARTSVYFIDEKDDE